MAARSIRWLVPTFLICVGLLIAFLGLGRHFDQETGGEPPIDPNRRGQRELPSHKFGPNHDRGAPGAVTGSSATSRKYALLVGVNDYDHDDLSKLDWAVNDAAEMRDVLAGAGYTVILLTAEEAKVRKDASIAPTCVNFKNQLKALVKQFAKGDTLLIGLAGHGLQFEGDEDGYFCPVDARPSRGRTETLVSIKWIYERLKKDAASGVKLLLVDACRSLREKTRSGIDAGNAPPPPDGVGVLLACKAGQTAKERDAYKHGVFFHHVLEGLKGGAKDEEGAVTWDSLRTYVKKRVPRDEENQTPEEAGRLAGIPPVLVSVGSGIQRPDPGTTTNDRPESGKQYTNNGNFDQNIPLDPEKSRHVYDLTKVDITKIHSFRSTQASIFGVMLNMSRGNVEIELEASLKITKLPGDKAWGIARKNDGEEIMGLFWGESDSLSKIRLRGDISKHLQGNTRRLVTLDVLDLKSDLVRLFLGRPDKVIDDTNPNLYNILGFTQFRHCYHEKGIEFLITNLPKSKSGREVAFVLTK